jgi:hypothetical protein
MPEHHAVAVCMYDYLGTSKAPPVNARAGVISLPSLSIKGDVATAIQLTWTRRSSVGDVRLVFAFGS